MPKYKVNRSAGWPILHEGRAPHQLGETFESDDPSCEQGVEQGYLIAVDADEWTHIATISGGEDGDAGTYIDGVKVSDVAIGASEIAAAYKKRPFTKEEKATLKK